MRPLRRRSIASFARSSGSVSISTRTGTWGAIDRNSSPSARVRFATERITRSPHSSSYGKRGMSLMWMPAQTTVPPFARTEGAEGRALAAAVAVREREAEALVRNDRLRISPVEVVAREQRPVAQVLPAAAAVAALAVGPAEPRDAEATAVLGDPHDLVAEDERQ